MRILEILTPGTRPFDGNWGNVTIDSNRGIMTLSFDGGEVRLGKTLVSAGDFSVFIKSGQMKLFQRPSVHEGA